MTSTERSSAQFLLDRARRRPIVLIAATVVVLLVITAIVYIAVRPHERSETWTVGAAGGVFGDDVQVTVPAAALTVDTTLEIVSNSDQGPDDATASDYAVPLSSPYEITFEGQSEVDGATVSVPLDADELPTIDGVQTTTADAFLAVYNGQLETWIPIPTTYDAATRRLVAEAPHFSPFQKYVVNPVKAAAGAVADIASTGGRALWSSVAKTFGFKAEEADCSKQDDSWTVSVSNSHFDACMVPAGDDYQLRMDNDIFLRYIVDPPDGYGIGPNDYDLGLDTASLLSRLISATQDKSVLPSRGRAQLSISADEASRIENGDDETVYLTPDVLGLILDAGLVALSVWPVAKQSVQVITNSTVRAALTEIAPGELTPALSVQKVQEIIQTGGGTAAGAKAVAAILSCGLSAVSALGANDGEDLLDAAVREGKECALSTLQENVEGSAKDLASLFTVFPDTLRTFEGLAVAGAISQVYTDLLGVTITVTKNGPGGGNSGAPFMSPMLTSIADGFYQGYIRSGTDEAIVFNLWNSLTGADMDAYCAEHGFTPSAETINWCITYAYADSGVVYQLPMQNPPRSVSVPTDIRDPIGDRVEPLAKVSDIPTEFFDSPIGTGTLTGIVVEGGVVTDITANFAPTVRP
ncbi:hypothetical protein [Naasia lichenicola]|uniref:Uncharacterized protein n=1 Tax=Naasia lichenicola TaxID=2565933 RepID=A0A4S4FQW4_9MICO|nr:hypothetical protein [Naasia lichenicola]THG30778.1 hypothetical protein E6C64_09065 [Naasia lichenicola]THG32015.1 hypothetical protein E6C64_08210 [Naasia lichenicola]